MKFLFSILLCGALAIGAFSQTPSKVLKQAEKALGGKKAYQTLRAVTRTGSVHRINDGATGSYENRTSLPDLLSFQYDIGGFEYASGFNGRSGWKRDSREGLSTLTGTESVVFQTNADFRNELWFNAKSNKSKIVSAPNAIIRGKNAHVLIMTTVKGSRVKMFFDVVSGLLVRDEISGGDITISVDHDDYRVVNGVQIAHFDRIETNGEILEVMYDEITAGPPLARSFFDFPKISGEPLPDITTLLAELQANEDKVEEILENYSYTQKNIKRELGKDGILRETESETHQLTFYKGNRIRRLIEKNGKPLSAKDQEKEDKDAAKQVEEIERKIAKDEAKMAKRSATGAPSDEGNRISIAELLRASQLLNPRRERFRGRDVIVFDFQPNPAFDYKNAKSMLKFFGKTAGVMWIDEKDKQVARLEATLADNFKIGGGFIAKLNKGASFTLEQERINNEIWLPTQADINLSARVLLVKGITINQVVRSFDYRRFETEVKDAKVNDEKVP